MQPAQNKMTTCMYCRKTGYWMRRWGGLALVGDLDPNWDASPSISRSSATVSDSSVNVVMHDPNPNMSAA